MKGKDASSIEVNALNQSKMLLWLQLFNYIHNCVFEVNDSNLILVKKLLCNYSYDIFSSDHRTLDLIQKIQAWTHQGNLKYLSNQEMQERCLQLQTLCFLSLNEDECEIHQEDYDFSFLLMFHFASYNDLPAI